MSELESLPDIGSVLVGRLKEAGIGTAEALLTLGDTNAFALIRAGLPEDACTHTRLALAGAVRGAHWHSLDERLREKLRAQAKA